MTVPKKPGYYWAKYIGKNVKAYPFIIVNLCEIEYESHVQTLEAYICGDDVDHPLREFKDWVGPLKDPDEKE
jgi:hypothetical protein